MDLFMSSDHCVPTFTAKLAFVFNCGSFVSEIVIHASKANEGMDMSVKNIQEGFSKVTQDTEQQAGRAEW